MAEQDSLINKTLPSSVELTELGPLPEEWQVVRLGEVFDIQQGKALSRKKDKGARPRLFLRTANVFWGRVELSNLDQMDFSETEEEKYRLQLGDLLVCEGGDVGRTAIWEERLNGVYYQNHLHRLRPKVEGVESRFFMYWMQAAITLLNLYLGTSNRTTIPNLSRSRLANFLIPLPPLHEQRAIAHVLWTVQRAKETTEKVIQAARELKKSLMRHLFTYGPVPFDQADQAPLKETEIGPVPKGWEVVSLEQCLRERLRNGHSARKSLSGHGTRTFTLSAVTQNRFSIDNTKVTVADPKKVKDLWVEPGDIFIERANTSELVGLAALYTGPPRFAIFPDLLVRVRVKENVVSQRFLAEYLLTPTARGYFRKNARKTAGDMPKINHTTIARIKIPLPPLPEQREIARVLQTVDRKIEAEERRKAALQALFKTMLYQLMTGKIRVPVGAGFKPAPTEAKGSEG